MKEKNIVAEKAYAFAVNIVKIAYQIRKEKHEYSMTTQLIKSSTSVGANLEEADGALTKPDFIYKVQIAFKEAKESKYWIRLLRDTNFLEMSLANKLIMDCDELKAIISSILLTSKSKNE
jgi:four helix bundle protein